MNKPERQKSIDRLSDEQIHQKRKDIMMCIQQCRKELLWQYGQQLDYIDSILYGKQQLQINFERFPCDDEYHEEQPTDLF